MKENKIENKKIRLAIIIGIIVIVILLLFGLSRCSDDGNGSGNLSETNEGTAEETEEIKLPENPSVGEAVTGEEIQDEAGLGVSDKDMDSNPTGLSSGDKLYDNSSDKSNTSSENKSENTKDEDSKDEDSEDEKQPEEEKKPVGEEESGQASEEDSSSSKKYGDLF